MENSGTRLLVYVNFTENRFSDESVPSIYILNAAALSKPHAVQQLAADPVSYDTCVAVITETHLKQKHTAGVVDVPGYMV